MPNFQGPAPDLAGIALPPGAQARWAPAAQGNFRPTVELMGSRNVVAIVAHTTEGSFESGVNWGQNPAAGATYHFIVGQDSDNGDIAQLVRVNDVAFHVSSSKQRQTGNSDLTGRPFQKPVWWRDDYAIWRSAPNPKDRGGRIYNTYTIGVALAGHASSIHNTMTKGGKQWQSLVALLNLLCGRYGIAVHRSWIQGHYELNKERFDPGAGFPWREILDEVQGEVNPTATINRIGYWAYAQLPPEPEEPAAFDEFEPRIEPEPPELITTGIPKRRARLEIGGLEIVPIGTSGLTRRRQLNPLIVDESLRIRFSITHSFEENESPWWIEIYNMADATAQRVIERGTHFSLSAGYNEVGLLCEGVIQAVKISRQGADVITRLLATGNESSPDLNAWMSANWPRGTPATTIMTEAARLMGFTLGATDHIPQIRGQRLVKPYSVNLPAKTVLEQILERYDLIASYFCGQVVIDQASPIVRPSLPQLEQGHTLTERERAEFERVFIQQAEEAIEVRREQAITINERNGMIGLPARNETGAEVTTVLNPAVTITRLVNIESRWLNGLYHLTKVTHQGDTWGGEFRTTATGEPVEQVLRPPFASLTG